MRISRKLAPLLLVSALFLPGGVPEQSVPQPPSGPAFLPGGVPGQTIPAHPAGLVCVVRESWCAMLVPGRSGAPCSCPTLYGRTAGIMR